MDAHESEGDTEPICCYAPSKYVTRKKTINQLEQRDFNNLDINHLIEELKDLGKSDKNALESNLEKAIK